MGLFRNLKDMTDTLRSDELKELKNKADAQPRSSMLDSVKAANSMDDQAGALQQQAVGMQQGMPGGAADPFAPGATLAGGIMGQAVVNSISDTGTVINNAPVCELNLTVTIPGREPYPVTHRQLLAQTAIPRFQPGATFSVRVDQNDPTQIVIG